VETALLIANVCLTLALVTITAIYTYWTKRIVTTTLDLEVERSKPVIAVSVARSFNKRNVANVVIGNYGLLPAKNLKLKVIDDFKTWPGQSDDLRFYLSKQNFTKNGISTLAPSQKIYIEVLMSGDLAVELREKPYRLNISYEFTNRGEVIKETAKEKVDFGSLPDYNIGSTELSKIADSLKKMEKLSK